VPTTVICFKRGTMPAGVTWPLGAISVTGSPIRTPRLRASSAPSTMPNWPGTSLSRLEFCIEAAMSVTSLSCAGSMPRTMVPRMSSPRASSACAATKGATPITCGFLRASCMVSCRSGSTPPPGP